MSPLQLKNADEVEFWHNPDKEGWLQSQGEVIKTWRRRWFVLKDGFLFRFLDQKVTHASKPRGIVDLSKVCSEPYPQQVIGSFSAGHC